MPGAQLLREGEHARSMFVVREGELQILKHGKGGTEYKLAVLKAGDCVGEMSLIDIQPRSATARARRRRDALRPGPRRDRASSTPSDVEAYALLVLNISREISRRLRVADEVLANMGMTAEAMWSDAVGTAHAPGDAGRAMPVVVASARYALRFAQRGQQLLHARARVAEQHPGVVLVEQRIVDAGVARRHAALASRPCFAFHTSSTGMPAIGLDGSSCAPGSRCRWRRSPSRRRSSGKSSLISSISSTMS